MKTKVAIIGAGFVGTACAKSMLLRGSCTKIVLLDDFTKSDRELYTRGVANDLSHGAVLCPHTQVEIGGYENITDADVVVVTAGANEKKGGAIDPKDPWGRLRLLIQNVPVYRDIIPQIVRTGCRAPIVVVTDPPDPLADVAVEERDKLGAKNPILGTGTFLDSIRFRLQLAKRFDCTPKSVEATVIGEHGKSQVYAWSTARIGGQLVSDLVAERKQDFSTFRAEVEGSVRDANIEIIQGTGASQHGIGIVTTRIVEAILRDEQLIEPVGLEHQIGEHRLTVSLPSRIGAQGAIALLRSRFSDAEEDGLKRGAALITKAVRIAAEGGDFDRVMP